MSKRDVGNAIIDMYAKCGCMEDACLCFKNMPLKNVVSWTALVAGHAGLVQEGWRVFDTMVHKYSITSMMEHYTCMVDLLAR
ncbi:hypothetical protein ACFX2I_029082 [Malus domestica]